MVECQAQSGAGTEWGSVSPEPRTPEPGGGGRQPRGQSPWLRLRLCYHQLCGPGHGANCSGPPCAPKAQVTLVQKVLRNVSFGENVGKSVPGM